VAANEAFLAARREAQESWRGRLRKFDFPGERHEAVQRSLAAEAEVETKRLALLCAWHGWLAANGASSRNG
jgi:hypothetical protein